MIYDNIQRWTMPYSKYTILVNTSDAVSCKIDLQNFALLYQNSRRLYANLCKESVFCGILPWINSFERIAQLSRIFHVARNFILFYIAKSTLWTYLAFLFVFSSVFSFLFKLVIFLYLGLGNPYSNHYFNVQSTFSNPDFSNLDFRVSRH